MAKTGLEILKAPGTTAGEIAAILEKGHPPFGEGEVQCDLVDCKDCWLACWLGSPPARFPPLSISPSADRQRQHSPSGLLLVLRINSTVSAADVCVDYAPK